MIHIQLRQYCVIIEYKNVHNYAYVHPPYLRFPRKQPIQAPGTGYILIFLRNIPPSKCKFNSETTATMIFLENAINI